MTYIKLKSEIYPLEIRDTILYKTIGVHVLRPTPTGKDIKLFIPYQNIEVITLTPDINVDRDNGKNGKRKDTNNVNPSNIPQSKTTKPPIF